MSDRCELSDLLVDQCACRVHAPAEDKPAPRPGAFSAQWHGRCPVCREHITPGEFIRGTAEGFIHDDCHEEDL